MTEKRNVMEKTSTTKRVITKEIFDWVKAIIIAVLIALIIRTFIFVPSIVPTGSMHPTICVNDVILVFKGSYWFKSVERGDIIVFKSPEDEDIHLVKRVAAMGGEMVKIEGGHLYIDGIKQNEPYIYAPMRQDFGPYKVPKDMYFVMGDNRNNSLDARNWEQKGISKDILIGKAVYRLGGLK